MAPLSLLDILLILIAYLPLTLAQTSTKCNPTLTTCPDDPALGTTFNETYNSASSLSGTYWTNTGAIMPQYPIDNSGMAFVIGGRGQAPTIQSAYYIFWGHVEVIMKAAAGQGIISSIVLLSDDLDEIDWEIMGGNTTHVETNYYGKGNATQMNALYYSCDNPQGGFHNYTINWSSQHVEWILDGDVVRTLMFDDAVDKSGKSMFPQTPMHLKIGNWAGGDPSNAPGTIAWAGGKTDYAQVPFTMTVKDVKVTDGTTNATSYSYGNLSGNWQSIKIDEGVSDVAKKIQAGPPLTLHQRWNKLSHTAQIAIGASAVGAVAFLAVLWIFCCFKQRRMGRRERMTEDAVWEKEQMELNEYKRLMHEQHFAQKGMNSNVSLLR